MVNEVVNYNKQCEKQIDTCVVSIIEDDSPEDIIEFYRRMG
jgi:hypothetical protein